MKMTLAEIAQLTGGELSGSGAHVIEGAAGLAEAGPTEVSFLENPKYASQVARSKAGCVFLPKEARAAAASGGPENRIYVAEPKWAFAQVLQRIEEETNKRPPVGISPKAEVHYETQLARGVSVGAFSVLERRVVVGEETVIGPQVYIGANVRIGRDCRIYPQVVIRENCVIGDRAIIHSGTVIGSDGFGFSTDMATGKHRKVPQVGNVVIEDDVEIGSNVSIDRATTGSTRVGAGTKIDNLVQLAHNVTVGRGCFIVSQVGVAGSTKVGNHVVLAGQVGVAGHLSIGDGTVVTAQTGVMSDVPPKAVLFGSPARPHREAMKLQALLNRLPEIYETIKEVKSRFGGEKAGAPGAQESRHAER